MDDFYHVALMVSILLKGCSRADARLSDTGTTYTMGGLEIGTNSAVHDADSKAIPGLFACGELAGGVHGANRLGGSSLL